MAIRKTKLDSHDSWEVSDEHGQAELRIETFDGAARITLDPEQARALARALNAAAEMTS